MWTLLKPHPSARLKRDVRLWQMNNTVFVRVWRHFIVPPGRSNYLRGWDHGSFFLSSCPLKDKFSNTLLMVLELFSLMQLSSVTFRGREVVMLLASFLPQKLRLGTSNFFKSDDIHLLEFKESNVKQWCVVVHKLEKVHLERKNVFHLGLSTRHLCNENTSI